MFVFSSPLLYCKQYSSIVSNVVKILSKKPLLYTPKHNYHMSYLMDSKHDERFVKIQKRAFHLYKDSILNFKDQPFNQKRFLLIFIDCVRTKQKYDDFQQIAQYGLSKLSQFKQILSIFTFATQLYLYNYPKRDQCYKLALKGFQLLSANMNHKLSSYHTMKFLIFIQKNVGLQRFKSEDYQKINFSRFKPLFLCFTLEMFYENKLQHYQVVKDVFEIFTESHDFIPFADIHHYKLATKKINDGNFTKFVEDITKHLVGGNRIQTNKDEQVGQIKGSQAEKDILQRQDAQFQVQQQQNVGKKQTNANKNTTKNEVKSSEHNSAHSNSLNYASASSPKPDSCIPEFNWQRAYQNDIRRRYTYYQNI